MNDPVQIRSTDEGHALGVWKDIVIVVFTATPAATTAAKMSALTDEMAKVHPGGFGMLHVVDTRSGVPPDQAARTQYVEMIRRHDDVFTAAAIVATGSGFVASMVRSVTAGFALMTRPKFPMKTFSSVADGATWLAEHMSADATALLEAYAKMRATVGGTADVPG